MKALLLMPAALLLAACVSTDRPAATTDTGTTRPTPGSDRDAHGCIGSAGYQWCQHNQRCERPWELAQAQGLANTAEAIDAYCAKPASPPQT
ncbi:hypothetical protein ACK1O1_13690 [Stenotrophomonas maltophilia]|jgi:outer membrane biogenesis lipoprotein LolB|uniref:hypothetical protein n=1 Tax=Stenotrophomonas TaxID=40323 RepID=UPI00201D0DA9|nr:MULTISPECIES: hypothetical protein [Stenotrophomonas]MBN5024467.1 hypothetical protein [Stenotrophomonas maltophilia]MDH1274507.1 hypothetical protein [Stenotrophomonas sp. GD03937]MDH1484996.1 hypothetical protein [Stenotrophomonas sp. GD03712]MDR2960744.1 hypothetical protein [Stenotrophomonas sp.]UQY95861.1 hypothetical protein LZ605_00385 [Stenotrophomonas maltophilia]